MTRRLESDTRTATPSITFTCSSVTSFNSPARRAHFSYILELRSTPPKVHHGLGGGRARVRLAIAALAIHLGVLSVRRAHPTTSSPRTATRIPVSPEASVVRVSKHKVGPDDISWKVFIEVQWNLDAQGRWRLTSPMGALLLAKLARADTSRTALSTLFTVGSPIRSFRTYKLTMPCLDHVFRSRLRSRFHHEDV